MWYLTSILHNDYRLHSKSWAMGQSIVPAKSFVGYKHMGTRYWSSTYKVEDAHNTMDIT